MLHTLSIATPASPFHMIIDHGGVVRASGFGTVEALAARLPKALQDEPLVPLEDHPYVQLVERYFAGDRAALDAIPRAQTGSPFQTQVWQAMSEIPYGTTINYTELAAAAGYPGATRAAGTACGQNRLILLVPCHRIVKKDGSVGSYLYGPAIKTLLLDYEKRLHSPVGMR